MDVPIINSLKKNLFLCSFRGGFFKEKGQSEPNIASGIRTKLVSSSFKLCLKLDIRVLRKYNENVKNVLTMTDVR